MEPDAPRILGIGDFDQRIGETFPVRSDAGPLSLTLVEVRELPHSPREGGGFRLEFSGPREAPLPQAIYEFDIGGEPHGIFIVPLDPLGRAESRYEAVFF